MRRQKQSANNGDKCCEFLRPEEHKKKQLQTGLFPRHHTTVIRSKKLGMASTRSSQTIHATEDLISMHNVNWSSRLKKKESKKCFVTGLKGTR